jgi:phosphoribosylformimino-5-aminoimidazole carboxamide ribotide isomerase
MESMKTFIVYPAIDLRNGRVARLQQGDPQRMTIYSQDPQRVAQQWIEAGCRWLHIVNLDGALGEEDNLNHLALRKVLDVAHQFGVQVQYGGGLRSIEDVERVLDLGVNRVIIGTLATKQPQYLEILLSRFGADQIAVAMDVKNNHVWSRGWQEQSPLSALDMARRMDALGVRTLVYTDILRDGMESGINLGFARSLSEACGMEIILAGGVRSLEDVRMARQAGLAGVIIGKALYDGQVNLQEALEEEKDNVDKTDHPLSGY